MFPSEINGKLRSKLTNYRLIKWPKLHLYLGRKSSVFRRALVDFDVSVVVLVPLIQVVNALERYNDMNRNLMKERSFIYNLGNR